jgi:DNA excision repair protein ERCC-2
MLEALAAEELDSATLQQIGDRHQVCPHELALELSPWVDLVLCDYNYVFDPRVYVRRLFGKEADPCVLLVDEAHNLPDRAREMYSAELDRTRLSGMKAKVAEKLPQTARALGSVNRAWQQWHKTVQGLEPSWRITSRQLPPEILESVRRFLREAESWLAKAQPASFREELLQCYFEASGFMRMAEEFDEGYVVVSERPSRGGRLRLFCLDPARLLREAIPKDSGVIFFSGTLTPLEFYRDCLGGDIEDRCLRLNSPFPPEHLAVLVHHRIATTYQQRPSSFSEVSRVIAAFTGAHPGNYLVFFPSYEYLNQVGELFARDNPSTPMLVQTPGMAEEQRSAFLKAFTAGHARPLVGFAVMGGIFGESIDLIGEQLSGAVMVGVGLPQICFERDLIRQHFDGTRGAGFDFAYRYPGINRVLQAAGRVIRSETDRGALLLIDRRFAEPAYKRLLPRTWRVTHVSSASEIQQQLREFWGAP